MSTVEAMALKRHERGGVMDRVAYGIQEFGDRVGLSKSTISKMVLEGKIRSAWVGGRRLIPAEELTRFANELRERAGLAPVA